MIVAAYGLILPTAVLEIPRYGCLNIHASLLPRWRGAAPIQRAILAGDQQTGITIMQMDAGLDTGDMLLRTPIDIEPTDTGGSLHDKLATQGARDILTVLDQVANQQLQPEKQDDALATYAHKLEKAEAEIDWSQDASALERLVRAFNPWPVAFTQLQDKPLRIYQAECVQQEGDAGTILSADKNGIVIACGRQALKLLQVQPSGSKPMDAAAFMNGYADKLIIGEKLA
jgi:methionyl-tRNA formyltransferase